MKPGKRKQDKARREEIKRRLKSELKKEIKPLLLGTLAMIGSVTANQAVPKLLGRVLDQNACPVTSKSNNISNSNSTSNNGLMLVILGGGVASFLRTTMLNRAQDSIASRLRMQVFAKLMKRNIQWYQTSTGAGAGGAGSSNAASDSGKNASDDSSISIRSDSHGDSDSDSDDDDDKRSNGKSPAEIQSILSDDVDNVSESFTTSIANTIRSMCSVVFATRNMLIINPHLLSISVGVVPIIGSAAVILNKFVKKIVSRQRDLSLQAEAFAAERVEHLSMVKISSREEDEIERYLKMQARVVKLGKLASWARGTFMGFMFSASSAALVMVFHAGGKDVAKGILTHGELKSFATYTFMLGLGTSGVMKGLGKIAHGLVCAERVYNLLDDDSGDDDVDEDVTNTAISVNASDVNEIKASNISFSYASSSKENANILNDISLDISRGQVVALVGSNGSGKSTVAKLLVALYKPKSGSIVAKTDAGGTIDMKYLDRETQSKLVQLVPQQPAIFNMSVSDNVTYTNPNASQADINKALEAANCSGFISKLDEGLNFNVGRNGSKLSGGQRQRIALARALLSDPSLLILDEPNSSMDAEGDNAVADAVKACRDGNSDGIRRGLLLISHRPASLKLANRIIVLKEGKVVEEGTFDALVRSKDSELCQLMPDLQ
mmetsp:Transcript_21598/g.32829  ORF Transcript_21598/g.32829 Transcript_21598/m.32829 type:complete len:665 (+) Transcript_21598:160-2154(+)